MPTYDYLCPKCKKRFELFHAITDDAPKRCPKCKAKAARVPSAGAGLLFKGSGFYITDYRSKGYKESAKQDKSSSGSSTGDSTGSGSTGSGSSTGSSSGEGSKGSGAKPAKPAKPSKSE